MSTSTPHPRSRAFAAPLLEVGGLWLLIVLGGVQLIAGLLDHWHQQELLTLERVHIELTLREIQDEIEGELSLGKVLQQYPRIQDLLERYLRKNPQLYSLDILDKNGRTLFSTDRSSEGEPLPPLAQAAALQGAASHQPWNAFIESTPMMGLDVRTPFGETAGHVSATYASHAAAGLSGPMVSAPLLLSLLATALAGMFAVWLATGHQRRLRHAQLHGRIAQIDAQLATTDQRLDEGSQRLDAVERIE